MEKPIILTINGTIKLPEGMEDNDFQDKFLSFLEDNDLSFTGVTDELVDSSEDAIDNQVFNFDYSIAEYMVPRLKKFKKRIAKDPFTPKNRETDEKQLTTNEWKRVIQDIIDGFEEVLKDRGAIDHEKIRKGLHLFSLYYGDLWI